MTLKNPFDKKKNKIELTSSTIANIFEDQCSVGREYYAVHEMGKKYECVIPPQDVRPFVVDVGLGCWMQERILDRCLKCGILIFHV